MARSAWLQGMPFATRTIDHGSFAVVKVGDLKDVPVYRSNQIAATTNSNGMALVPNLLSYQNNQLTIDPVELPIDAKIKSVKEMAVPYARSGMFVEFAVRRSRNALVELRLPGGAPVPIGTRVIASPSGKAFFVAKRGQVYLTDLENDNRIAVQWKDGRCELAIPLAAETAPPNHSSAPLPVENRHEQTNTFSRSAAVDLAMDANSVRPPLQR